MKAAELKIEGMSCGHCVMSVRKELSMLSDLKVEDVQVGTARVTFDETRVTVKKLSEAVENAGYKLLEVR